MLATELSGSKERDTKANAIAAYFWANPHDRLLKAVVDGLHDVYQAADVFAAKKCGLAVSGQGDESGEGVRQQQGSGEDEDI